MFPLRNFTRMKPGNPKLDSAVLDAACAAILDHYAEELAEHVERARNA